MHMRHVIAHAGGRSYRCTCRASGDLAWAISHAIANQYRVDP
jgi:hypothetical protein